MRLKITKNLTYLEARKQLEQKPEFSFSHIFKSLAAKPETKTAATQYSVEDCKITESSKVLIARKPNRNNISQNQNVTSSKSLSEQAKVSSKPNQPSTNAKLHSASSRVQRDQMIPSNSITNLELWLMTMPWRWTRLPRALVPVAIVLGHQSQLQSRSFQSTFKQKVTHLNLLSKLFNG